MRKYIWLTKQRMRIPVLHVQSTNIGSPPWVRKTSLIRPVSSPLDLSNHGMLKLIWGTGARKWLLASAVQQYLWAGCSLVSVRSQCITNLFVCNEIICNIFKMNVKSYTAISLPTTWDTNLCNQMEGVVGSLKLTSDKLKPHHSTGGQLQLDHKGVLGSLYLTWKKCWTICVKVQRVMRSKR